MRHFLAAAVCLTACQPDGATDADDTANYTPDTPAHVAHRLSFGRLDEDNRSPGFNLDDDTTPGACGIEDYTSPDGDPGIDNSFAVLLPLMEASGGAAFENLVQAAVDSGEFLLLFEVTEGEGDCEVLSIARAGGSPLLGADGALLPHQTFPIREDIPLVVDTCATRVDDHTVVAHDLTLAIQLQIFEVPVNLQLDDVSVRIRLHEDGTADGEVAGGINVEELWNFIGPIGGIGTQLLSVLESVIFARGDLALDGTGDCSHMSAVMVFEALPGYFAVDSTE